MKSKRRAWTFLLGVAMAAACGGVEPQRVESWAQWEISLSICWSETEVVLLVIDDTPTVDSAQLRETALEGIRSSFLSWDGLGQATDPARWRPVDRTVVLVLPSASGSDRFVGPNEVPAFAYQMRNPSEATAEALADVIVAEVSARLAPVGASFRPLEAAADAAALLASVREASDEREQQLVKAGSGGHAEIRLALAVARDDESPLPVASYDLPPPDPAWFWVAALFPSDDPELCEYPGSVGSLESEPSSRVSAWLNRSKHRASAWGWPCGQEEIEQGSYGLFGWSGICTFRREFCTSRPILVQPSGRAECLLLVESYEPDQPCDAERGWLDPKGNDGQRRPTIASDERGTYRVCEIAQLEGAALAACRTTIACEGCGSGWCRSDLPEDGTYDDYEFVDDCQDREHPANLRFVGGAMAGANVRFRIRCNLET